MIQQPVTAQLANRSHAITNATHTRKHHPACRGDRIGVMADDNFIRSDMLESAGNGMQITHTVINHGNTSGHGSENPFRRRAGTRYSRVTGDSHSQCPTKSLENRFCLMVCIVAAKVIDVQRHIGVIHKALKKFNEKIDIKLAHLCAGEGHVKLHTRATTAVQDHTRDSASSRGT